MLNPPVLQVSFAHPNNIVLNLDHSAAEHCLNDALSGIPHLY